MSKIIAEALPLCQLSKGHTEILIEACKASDIAVSLIASDATAKCVNGHKVHDL